MNSPAELDIGPLTWVKTEIDLALERASEALRAHDAAPDGDRLKAARSHLHQAHGALAIVGLAGVMEFSQAIEQLLAAAERDVSWTAEVHEASQQGLAALRHYLDDLVAGMPNQPLRLLPTFQSMQKAQGLSEPTASELFFPDLSRRPPRREVEPAPLAETALSARLKAARLGFERGLLKWLKNEPAGLRDMRNSVAIIEHTQLQPADRAFWWVSLAFFDSLIGTEGELPASAKRLCARIDGQIKKLLEGTRSVAERLIRDLLYEIAVSPVAGEHIECVRAAYGLPELIPATTESELDTLKPVIRALRESIAAAKEEWDRFCSGLAAALPAFHERLGRVVEQADTLHHLELSRLLAAVANLVGLLRKNPLVHNDAVALEIATALLLVESALDTISHLGIGNTAGGELGHQVDIMTGRLTALMKGESLEPQAAPQLDDIARRAQEKLLMSQVAREIQANLAQIEQTLDAYFRDPARRGELSALDTPIRQVEGALAVLGQERAVAVLHECAVQIRAFSEGTSDQDATEFEDVARKLSALGFFIEKLAHGPADLDEILSPPAASIVAEPGATSSVEADLAQAAKLSRTIVGALQDAPENESLRQELRENLESLREDAHLVDDAALVRQANEAIEALSEPAGQLEQKVAALAPSADIVAPSPEAVRLADASAEQIDAELLGIFLEEAQEVLATIAEHLPQAIASPADREVLTTLRRSFHTLKGSSRMVGLTDFGETAWAVEQVMNRWLQREDPATPALLDMMDQAQACFSAWVAQLAAGGGTAYPGQDLVALCESLKTQESQPTPVELPGETSTTASIEAPVAPSVEAPASTESAVLESEASDQEAAPGSPAIALSDETLPDEVAPLVQESPVVVPEVPAPPAEDRVIIGDLALSPVLFSMYLEEARMHVEDLQNALPGLVDAPPGEEMVRAAHTLASSSGTVGFAALHELGRTLETALDIQANRHHRPTPDESALLAEAIDALAAMLEDIASRRLPTPAHELIGALKALAAATPDPATETVPAVTPTSEGDRRQLRIENDLDPELLPYFLDESVDLMGAIGRTLRAWRGQADNDAHATELKRLLHTLKGSARMAGAMAIGELVHSMETRVAQSGSPATAGLIDDIEASFDRAALLIDELRPTADAAAIPAPAGTDMPAAADIAPAAPVVAVTMPDSLPDDHDTATQSFLRVRPDLVDDLVNTAGEIAIARSRIEGEMRGLKASLYELTENVIRLRGQVRELEIQAESQIQSRQAQASDREVDFDPLEMDRFTRLQELTRMMAESVNDVSTVQHNLLRNLDHADGALSAQSRLNRDLSQSLMSIRMVPFNAIAERLHRVVRQTAKDLDKRANLDIRGGQTELDRSVLERMVAPIEHLLRNAVAHGLESRAARQAAGKSEQGDIILSLSQEGNEIVLDLADDGAGLDFAKIRAKAEASGLIVPGQSVSEPQLAQFIFSAGFTTADAVSAVAGRGVGMDVVRNETASLGGRIETRSETGRGTRFRIYLPLTLALVQALLVRSGNRLYAIPSVMVEQASELKPEAIEKIRTAGAFEWQGKSYPWHYLARMLGQANAQPQPQRRHWMILVKGGEQRIAMEVDGLIGNQEVVVKNIGPQLARVVGIAGATVLADGEIALILNPIALANREGRMVAAAATSEGSDTDLPSPAATARPTVLVVDDSLTVRKITGRLLERSGYKVVTAKDGVDALEQMTDFIPDVMLADIEMPRMDGFDLARNVKADKRLQRIPIIMITSRTADKHRNYAREIGVEHYLGKPYNEDELLRLIAGFLHQLI